MSSFYPCIFGFYLFVLIYVDLLGVSQHVFELWILEEELVQLLLSDFISIAEVVRSVQSVGFSSFCIAIFFLLLIVFVAQTAFHVFPLTLSLLFKCLILCQQILIHLYLHMLLSHIHSHFTTAICYCHIGSTLNQQLTHFQIAFPCSIKEWGLPCYVILVVDVYFVLDELMENVKSIVLCQVVQGSLPVYILLVQIESLFEQQVQAFFIAFPAYRKQNSLLVVILKVGVSTVVDQQLHDVKRVLSIDGGHCKKYGGLPGLVLQSVHNDGVVLFKISLDFLQIAAQLHVYQHLIAIMKLLIASSVTYFLPSTTSIPNVKVIQNHAAENLKNKEHAPIINQLRHTVAFFALFYLVELNHQPTHSPRLTIYNYSCKSQVQRLTLDNQSILPFTPKKTHNKN